ncbi:MAG: sigma-70 family RNA polymerase sigma factor [bacterium]|nr:sigma-70 family RNA polymerase sigma factor [bacterium]
MKPESPNDSERLLARIRAGDKDAFSELMAGHARLVMHIVARSVDDHEDRKDLCQDIFLKVYAGLDGFRGESRLSTWIARIAVNTCVHYLEKKKPVSWTDAGLPDGGPADTAASGESDGGPDPDLVSSLHREIGRLPVHYRLILTLFHLDGMPITEIAGAMDMPEGTVKNRLFRARRLLKNRLLAVVPKEELCGTNI